MKKNRRGLALLIAAGVVEFFQACQKDDGLVIQPDVVLKNRLALAAGEYNIALTDLRFRQWK